MIGGLDRMLMAETEIRAGTEEDTAHVVHFAEGVAADQVARIWLHEITDILQRQGRPATGGRCADRSPAGGDRDPGRVPPGPAQ